MNQDSNSLTGAKLSKDSLFSNLTLWVAAHPITGGVLVIICLWAFYFIFGISLYYSTKYAYQSPKTPIIWCLPIFLFGIVAFISWLAIYFFQDLKLELKLLRESKLSDLSDIRHYAINKSDDHKTSEAQRIKTVKQRNFATFFGVGETPPIVFQPELSPIISDVISPTPDTIKVELFKGKNRTDELYFLIEGQADKKTWKEVQASFRKAWDAWNTNASDLNSKRLLETKAIYVACREARNKDYFTSQLAELGVKDPRTAKIKLWFRSPKESHLDSPTDPYIITGYASDCYSYFNAWTKSIETLTGLPDPQRAKITIEKTHWEHNLDVRLVTTGFIFKIQLLDGQK